MADLRIGASPPTVTRPLPAARAEAVKAAQRAFFETALGGEMQAAAAPAQVASPVSPVSSARPASFDAAAPPPRTPLRPGSLLDIKV